MLINKKYKIKIYNSNIKSYKKKYNCKSGDEIFVDISDIPIKSHIEVEWVCDYCNEKQKQKRYCDYTRHKLRNPLHKDCCEKCKGDKIKESNMKKYGLENVMQIKEFKNRQNESCFSNLGVYHPYQNKEILNKTLIKAKKTMYENNSAPCSRQQKYIHNVVGGELNFPINTLSLDIAFPKEKIYIEYDGGGHKLQINFGHITYNEYIKKQRKREYLLQSKGWRLIRIVSEQDLLPQAFIIKSMIKEAKEYLNSGHTWIEYNIDKSLKVNSTENTYYNFKNTYKISELMVS